MNLFNFGGTNINPLLNALGSAPTGAFSGLNPAASAGASFGALPSMAGVGFGAAPLGGGLAGTFSNMSSTARTGLESPSDQGVIKNPLTFNDWAAMFANAPARQSQMSQPQQIPMGDYAAPQTQVGAPSYLIPMNQLVGRLLARGGA
ncbi:hypothetical protein [Burkholderia cepacia]|uniref:hypothetical protein n=1 Tax=Burkholderia cepacia TaxID=292 RepID=UPI001F3EFF6D|nr:hypothetical protein [Burkholderia cepacia]UIY60080.1 hypothetical protein LZ568_18765 [Burkholderia cepacia]